MADEILRIGAMIDLGQILPGLDTLASKTEAATSQMTSSFTRLQSGLVLSQSAIFDLEKEGGSIAPRIVPSLNQLPPALGHVGSSSRGAKEAMRGLGEEIHVHLPRFVSSFLATLGPVGGIMAAAFAPIAIIGLIEFLGKIPGAIEKMSDSIMGFGEAQKAAFAETVKDSDQAFIHAKNLQDAQRNLAQEVKILGDIAEDTFLTRWTKATDEAAKSQSKLLLLFPGLSGVVASIEGLANANSHVADAATAAEAKQRELLKQNAEDTIKIQDATLTNEKEYLKLGEIGASAYSKMQSQLAILNVEKAEELLKLQRENTDTAENVRLVNELFAAKRAAVEKTAGIAGGEEGIAAAKAQVEAEKSTALAIIAAHLKAAEDIVSIDKTQWGQLLVTERVGEDERYAAEVKAQEKLKALALRNQLLTNKPAAPEVTGINAKIEAENIAHQAKMRSIDADATKDEMAMSDSIQAHIVESFTQRQKAAAEDAEREKLGRETILQMDQEQVSMAEQIANRTLAVQTASDDRMVASHRESRAKWAADETTAINQWYASQKTILERQLSDEVKYHGKDTEEYQRMLSRMYELDLEWERKAQTVNKKLEETTNQTFQRITNDFNNSLQKWISGEERFRYAWVGMWSGALNDATLYLVKIGERFIAHEILKLAVEKGGIAQSIAVKISGYAAGLAAEKSATEADVMIQAGIAAAAAFAQAMQIPVVGPAIAPGAASAAFAATVAAGQFDEGGLAAKTGMAMIHQNEVVMPADVSTAFRSMAAGGGIGGGGNISVPVHMGSVSAIDARGVSKVLAQQGRAIQRSVIRAVRNSGAIARGGIRR